jgi:hypothetical protein
MSWLVIVPVDGIYDGKLWPRWVAPESWKGWPKAKNYLNQITEGERMAGKTRVHSIGQVDVKGEMPNGTGVVGKKLDRQLSAPPEVQEIVARRNAPEVTEVENPNEVPEVEVPKQVAKESPAKAKGGRPKKAVPA